MKVSFYKQENTLILRAESDRPLQWIYDEFKQRNSISINRTFYFEREDLFANFPSEANEVLEEETTILFVFAKTDDVSRYFRINKKVLGIEHDIYFQKDMDYLSKYFVAERQISIFKRIDKLLKEDFYIGDYEDSNISIKGFNELIDKFPNKYELDKYADARISLIVRNQFDGFVDALSKYESYMNKKESYKGIDIESPAIKNAEKEKFILVKDILLGMLLNESGYSEEQWQKEILKIILLLFPKYIRVFPKVNIKDLSSGKYRELDYMLIDSNGNIDIIEIKKPFDRAIVSSSQYRDNYIPLRELSGSIMQVEKYIYYLNQWGHNGEEILTTKYKDLLPTDFRIQIVNPCGIVIMGRENNLTKEQKKDFEIIKRKYKNIVDIITYDDLIRRIDLLINKFSVLSNISTDT